MSIGSKREKLVSFLALFNLFASILFPDYNYYDYNNMLTAITRFSPTIKFVEYNKKHKVDIAQAANVENFNRKLKNVFGGFHNDSGKTNEDFQGVSTHSRPQRSTLNEEVNLCCQSSVRIQLTLIDGVD
jgi:hypothetical protein